MAHADVRPVRIRLADPGEVDTLLDADAYRRVLAEQ